MRLDSLVIISLLVSPQLVNLFQASYSLSKIGYKLITPATYGGEERKIQKERAMSAPPIYYACNFFRTKQGIVHSREHFLYCCKEKIAFC